MDNDKLVQLAELEGYNDSMDMLEDFAFDSIVPGICVEDGCDYIADVEPDQGNGWCELCGENSVVSCLILAGIM